MQNWSKVATDIQTVLENVAEVSERFAKERKDRQRRRELVKDDFDALKDAGFLLTAVPVEYGGVWENVARSTRPISEMMRILAHGDPSVSLVSAMHPAVIFSWLSKPQAPAPYTQAWDEQRRWVFQTALDGHWWGTIISEPGSGGDPSRSKSIAKRGSSNGTYLITGQKHFGSGSGITSFMITLGVPEGEPEPDRFFMDMRGVPWDGSAGVKLIAPWDGHGMTATQSHGMMFEDFPATRTAWPDSTGGGGLGTCLFTAVITGIIETAVDTAREHLAPRRASMRPYEQTEWTRIEIESWLIQQAYEGMLRAVEGGSSQMRLQTLLGKESVAELAESVMLRISKVIGGSAYSRNYPYGFWLEDVRALGFLRPPWGFAFDTIFDLCWDGV